MTVRWIEESVTGVRWLGLAGLTIEQNFHARSVLASWNKSQNFVFPGYPSPQDMMKESWNTRDAQMLGNFVNWWNIAANPPLANWGQSPLSPPSYATGIQQSDLTTTTLSALNTWAIEAGLEKPSCIEKCLIDKSGKVFPPSPPNLGACLLQCGIPGYHGGGIPPGGGGGPSVGVKCPPGQHFDDATKMCQPDLPVPPAPIPPSTPTASSTASSTGTSSGVGLIIGGAIILSALAIFAATMKAPGPVKANPEEYDPWLKPYRRSWRKRRKKRRRRTNPKRRKKTPMLVDIQCDTAHGFREFKRIALGGTDPQQMYGYSTADGWQLPDAPEHMSDRFHQLLRATGCRVVTIQGG